MTEGDVVTPPGDAADRDPHAVCDCNLVDHTDLCRSRLDNRCPYDGCGGQVEGGVYFDGSESSCTRCGQLAVFVEYEGPTFDWREPVWGGFRTTRSFVVVLHTNLRKDQLHLPIPNQRLGRTLVDLLVRGELSAELLAWRTEQLVGQKAPFYAIIPVGEERRRQVLQGNHRWQPAGADLHSTWYPYPDVTIQDVAICACGRVRRKRIGIGGAIYFQFLKPGTNPTKAASWYRTRLACPLDHWSDAPIARATAARADP